MHAVGDVFFFYCSLCVLFLLCWVTTVVLLSWAGVVFGIWGMYVTGSLSYFKCEKNSKWGAVIYFLFSFFSVRRGSIWGEGRERGHGRGERLSEKRGREEKEKRRTREFNWTGNNGGRECGWVDVMELRGLHVFLSALEAKNGTSFKTTRCWRTYIHSTRYTREEPRGGGSQRLLHEIEAG